MDTSLTKLQEMVKTGKRGTAVQQLWGASVHDWWANAGLQQPVSGPSRISVKVDP